MRIPKSSLVAATFFSRYAFAQSSVLGNEGAENSTTPSVVEGDHTVHFVDVGKANHNFYPNSIVANPGDIVMFKFYPTNHSVIKAAYGYPCVPYEDLGLEGGTFFSGFFPTLTADDPRPTWNLTINSTEPIFYYCGAEGSCTDWGMVGGINLNASTPISNQIGLARQADYMLLPGEPFPSEAEQASLASLAAKATTATFTVTATGGGHSHSGSAGAYSGDKHYDEESGLSTGATAGIAVGAAVVALAGAGLLLLLLRTRKLKKKLDAQANANAAAGGNVPNNPNAPPGGLQSPMQQGYTHPPSWIQQRTMSQLPPYEAGQDMYKPPHDSEGGYAPSEAPSGPMSPHLSGMQSPHLSQLGSPYGSMHGQHPSQPFLGFGGPGGQDHRMSNRYTTHSAFHSELDASESQPLAGPRVEMDASEPPQSRDGRFP